MTTLLPEWLTVLLPEPATPALLAVKGSGLEVVFPDGTQQDFKLDDLKGVAEATRNYDLKIAKEVYSALGKERDFGMLSFPVSKHFCGMLMSHTDDDRLRLLESDYETSLRSSIRYEADPTDWVKAYEFIDNHPAFWINTSLEKFPWHWETSGHCQRLWHHVSRHEGETVVEFETGGHVKGDSHPSHDGRQSNYASHYHDYRLDAYGDSFENAYVQLASLVSKFFYPDGTEKPEVEHEKPAWVLELEERMKEIDARKEEEED